MSKRKEGKYAYCVIETKEEKSFGHIGIGDRSDEVYTVHHRNLAMVVSNSPITAYPPIKKYAFTHEKVIAEVMKTHTVIPMSFGVIFNNDKEIRLLLNNNYPELEKTLQKLTNKIELGLKVFLKKECFADEIEQGNPDITRLKNEINSLPVAETYHKKIQLGTLVQAVVEDKRLHYAREIHERLGEFAAEAKLNNTVGERMLLNSAFLVERDREQEFDEKVNEVFLKHSDRLEFKYSGPWPPYNFVNIKMRLES